MSRGSPFIPGYESCTARLLPDGSLELLVGIMSHGQGLETTLAQVAHQELTIPIERIAVRHGDTGVSPFGNGTNASRSMVMAGGAVAKTSRLLREKVLRVGAHLLQTDAASVRCEDGRVVGATNAIGIDEVARVAHLRMEALPSGVEPLMSVTGTYQPAVDTGVFAYATHAAVVAVDPRTGHVELLGFRRGGGLRDGGQPHDRRRAGARRRRAGDRHRALRGDPLRRGWAAACDQLRRLPHARRERNAGHPHRASAYPDPAHRVRGEGHGRGRGDRVAMRRAAATC